MEMNGSLIKCLLLNRFGQPNMTLPFRRCLIFFFLKRQQNPILLTQSVVFDQGTFKNLQYKRKKSLAKEENKNGPNPSRICVPPKLGEGWEPLLRSTMPGSLDRTPS